MKVLAKTTRGEVHLQQFRPSVIRGPWLRLQDIRLLNNKFRGLSPSGGCASLSFDQGVPKKLPTTAPSSRSERHLTVFYIDQIVPGFVVYYLNCYLDVMVLIWNYFICPPLNPCTLPGANYILLGL